MFGGQTGGELGGKLTNDVAPRRFEAFFILPGCECSRTAAQPIRRLTWSCFHVFPSETVGFYRLDRHGIVRLLVSRGRSLHVVGWGQHRICGPLQWPRPMSFEALDLCCCKDPNTILKY